MSVDNGLGGPRIALLIDFDNVILGVDEPGFDAELVVNALRERGTIVMGRAYGDWYRHNKHRRKLMEQGLELVETPAFGPVIKNSADIRIALDGFEIGMTQHHIDTFCLVSGDSDFLPLVKKLQYLGKRVLVIAGNKFTSDMLRRNCNEFISYENLLAQSVGATEDATTLDGAFALLHRAIAALRDRGSDIRSSTVKQMMLQLNPVFSEKTFNCNQFRGFLDKGVDARIIKLGARDRVSGEITVLLPEEEEKPQDLTGEIPERRERRFPERRTVEGVAESEGRPDRRRRAEMRAERAAQLSSGVDSIDAVMDLAAADENAAPAEGVQEEAPQRGRREEGDLFTPAGNEELTRATTTSALLGRGMKRGRLRFSSGKIQASPPAAAESEAPPSEDALAGTVDFPVVPVAKADTPELAGIFPVVESAPEAAPSEEAVPEGLLPAEAPAETAAPAEEAVTEGLAVATEEKPKTRTRRRTTTKKSPAKKAADKAAEAEAPATEAAPAPEPVAAEAPTETAAPEAPAKKPARRRTMRKKADIEPASEG